MGDRGNLDTCIVWFSPGAPAQGPDPSSLSIVSNSALLHSKASDKRIGPKVTCAISTGGIAVGRSFLLAKNKTGT